MKFSIFTDLHCYPGVFKGGTAAALEQISRRAEEAGSRFILHAGDFSHGPSLVPELVEQYNRLPIPTYHCLGNHDTDHTSLTDTLVQYGMPDCQYFFDCEGYRFVICDTNYYRIPETGEYVHYDRGNYYKYGPYRDFVNPEQLAWLKETIESSPFPCVLVSHASLERPDGVQNRAEVLAIIREANEKRPHSVILCINGHHHQDFVRILDNVCYLDLNSASYFWVVKEHSYFPKELCEEYRLVNHTLVYNDPIHAVITLDGTGITIEGMESSMFLGVDASHVSPSEAGNAGRDITARVSSLKIALD